MGTKIIDPFAPKKATITIVADFARPELSTVQTDMPMGFHQLAAILMQSAIGVVGKLAEIDSMTIHPAPVLATNEIPSNDKRTINQAKTEGGDGEKSSHD
jgi:hypothetical protein